jgi:hypothetical protein
MAEILPDILTRATTREDQVLEAEERKIQRVQCPKCQERLVSRTDGLCSKCSGLRLTDAEVRRRTKRFVERNAPRYAKLHFQAAQVAAKQGDSKPAMEGLVWGGVVEPVATRAAAVAGPGGVQVYVGVKLPGLGE